MTKSQSHVGCLVANVALGRDGKAFQKEIERLTDHMGPEWVVNRIKVLWNAANHLRNGDRVSAQELYREHGIAYHKYDMTPRGPLRTAVKQYVAASRPSVIKRKAAALRFYTMFRLPNLTQKQWEKAYTAITDPYSFETESKARDLVVEFLSKTESRILKDKWYGPYSEDWTPPVDDRYVDNLRAMSYYYSPSKLPKEFHGKPYASLTLSFLENTYIPESLDRITPLFEMREEFRDQDPWWDLKPVGKITALQEQGAKARVVCMPSAPLQLAFAPLHKELASLAEKAYPGASCVRDQQRGVYGVLRHMQEGKRAYCTDLSSATDRFPRSYSVALLEKLGYKKYARALEDVCQKPFVGPHGEKITYGTGQPMGLYGSFPLFHLSNLTVADLAEKRALEEGHDLDYFQNGYTFYVLGDDVVFSDPIVSRNYRAIMAELEVPISEHKSFEGELAEFAGFMVTKSKQGFVAFRPYKVPDVSYISNPISFLDSLGSRVSLKSPYWAKQWSLFRETIGSRGLDLAPHIGKDEDFGPNPFRGDTQTLVNLANALHSVMPGLPDISGSLRVNSIPAFHERRFNEFYGYSPDKLVSRERVRKDLPLGALTGKALKDDPLMREVRERREKSRLSSTQDGRNVTVPSPPASNQPSEVGSLNPPEKPQPRVQVDTGRRSRFGIFQPDPQHSAKAEGNLGSRHQPSVEPGPVRDHDMVNNPTPVKVSEEHSAHEVRSNSLVDSLRTGDWSHSFSGSTNHLDESGTSGTKSVNDRLREVHLSMKRSKSDDRGLDL
jgi:hypothetical protein